MRAKSVIGDKVYIPGAGYHGRAVRTSPPVLTLKARLLQASRVVHRSLRSATDSKIQPAWAFYTDRLLRTEELASNNDLEYWDNSFSGMPLYSIKRELTFFRPRYSGTRSLRLSFVSVVPKKGQTLVS